MSTVQRSRVSLGQLRWRTSGNRYVLTAVIVLLGALAAWRTAVPPVRVVERPAEVAGIDFATSATAERFTAAYLGFDAEAPEKRTLALAPFMDEGEATSGYEAPPVGSRTVTATRVVQQLPTAQGTRYTVAADTRPDGRLYLAVTVGRDRQEAIRVVGFPAVVGAPLSAAAAEDPAGDELEDAELARVVTRALRNYLAGSREDLAADLAPGAVVSVPSQPLELVSAEDLRVPRGVSDAVLATVSASTKAGEQLRLTYEVAIDRPAGRWQVVAIQTNPTSR